ncbi:MAG: hypothetical protein KC777_06485 [Cyanobacteria bacterium HKST-UBA02]|nr:hypothetical protein [Cyanobacteria bacterium HKST-UBA02]
MSEDSKPEKIVPPYAIALVVLLVLIGAAVAYWFMAGSTRRDIPREKGPIRVLMVGSGLLIVNDIPNMVRMIGSSKREKHQVEVTSVAVEGFSLSQHLQEKSALKCLSEADGDDHFDFVVLQPERDALLAEPFDNLQAVREFGLEAKKSGAKVVLLMPWADRGEDARQEVVSALCRRLSQRLAVEVAPSGDVLFEAARRYPELKVFEEDNHHASQIGAWLVASSVYSAVTGRRSAADRNLVAYDYGDVRIPFVDMAPSRENELAEMVFRQVEKDNRAFHLGMQERQVNPTSVLKSAPGKKKQESKKVDQE